MAKMIAFDQEARDAMRRGVGKLARAVYKLAKTPLMNDWISQSIQLWRKQTVQAPQP